MTLEEILGAPVHEPILSIDEVKELEQETGWVFPPDVRDAIRCYGGAHLTGGVATGAVLERYRSWQTLLATRGDFSDHKGQIPDLFYYWATGWGIVPEVVVDWVPKLVLIIFGHHGAFFLDFAYDAVDPPVVYVDYEWQENERLVTSSNFHGVVYAADSFSSLVANHLDSSDEVGFRDKWIMSPEEQMWIEHRSRMAGLK